MSIFNSLFLIASAIIFITIILIIVKSFKSNIKDTNGDGKIDANDIINSLNIEVNEINNSKENKKPKTKKCSYCDSIVKDDVFVCPNCGANLGI